jgi:hypothetical protein
LKDCQGVFQNSFTFSPAMDENSRCSISLPTLAIFRYFYLPLSTQAALLAAHICVALRVTRHVFHVLPSWKSVTC